MSKPNKEISEWVADPEESDLMLRTVGDLLVESAINWPEKEAIVYGHQPEVGDIRWTYKELNDKTTVIAKGLLESGYRPGESIAVWGPNHPEWILSEYAIAKAGLKLVTLNPLYKEMELEFALNSSKVSGIIHADTIGGEEIKKAIESIRDKVPSLQSIHSFTKGIDSLVNLGKGSSINLPQINPEDIFMIQYTSGTTGVPKSAQMQHQSLITTSRNSHIRWQIGVGDKVCHGFPLFHIGGSACMTLGAAVRGAVSLPLFIFKAQATLDIIEKEKCSVFIGVPTMLIAMLEDPTFEKRDFSNFKCIIVGGANPPLELLRKCENAFGVDMINGYGQTETCGVTATALPSDTAERKAIAGLPMPGVSVRILDKENEIVPNDIPGELHYKGPGLMKGYGNLSDGSSGINKEGWFPTGDLATMNEEGYLNIVGRAKEMIIRGGENLYPIEIENYLLQHPGVLEVAVLGLKDEKYGEEACAVIRRDASKLNNEEELRSWCRKKISRWKIPKYIFFQDNFPMTPSGKIKKFKLQEKYLAQLGLNNI